MHEILRHPIFFHKFLFRSGNDQYTQAERVGINMYFSFVNKSERHLCYIIVGAAKANQLSMLCDESILVVIQLGISHNMNIDILSHDETLHRDTGNQF